MNILHLFFRGKAKKLFTPNRFVFQNGPGKGTEKGPETQKPKQEDELNPEKVLDLLKKAGKTAVVENKDWTPGGFDKVAEHLADTLLTNGLEARLAKELILAQLNSLDEKALQEIKEGGFNFMKITGDEITFCKKKNGENPYIGNYVKILGGAERMATGSAGSTGKEAGKAKTEAAKPKKPEKFTLGVTAVKQKYGEAIDALEAKVGHKLHSGDRLKIDRYENGQWVSTEVIYRTDKNGENGKFVYKNNNPALLFKSDKITYLPKEDLRQKEAPYQLDVPGFGQVFIVGRAPKAKNGEDYMATAEDIINDHINRKERNISLHRTMQDEILASGITPKKYGDLLVEANRVYEEKIGKEKFDKLDHMILVKLPTTGNAPLPESAPGEQKALKTRKLAEQNGLRNDNMFVMAEQQKKPVTFMSKEKLENLRKGVPGVPLSESWQLDKSLKNNSIIKDAKKFFAALGLYNEVDTVVGRAVHTSNSVCVVDSPKNRTNLMGQEVCDFNTYYKGREITVRVENGLIGRTIKVAAGYDQTTFDENASFTDNFGFDAEDNKKAFDQIVEKGNFPAAVSRMTASPNEEGIILDKNLLDELNKKLTYEGPKGEKISVDLDGRQFLEFVFRLYSFDELNSEGCVQKVQGHEKGYALTRLPASLKKENLDYTYKNLAYAIKWGGAMDDVQRQTVAGAQEKAQDIASNQTKYERNLRRIFIPSATAYKASGEKVSMEDLEAEEASGRDTDNIFYNKYSGGAAYDNFRGQLTSVDKSGRTDLDRDEINGKLKELYTAGIRRLESMPSPTPKYQQLLASIKNKPDLRDPNVDIDNIDDWRIEIIRLGFVDKQAEAEIKQNESVRQALTEQLDKAAGPLADAYNEKFKGEHLTKDEMEGALHKIPVSFLLSYQNVSNKEGGRNNGFDLHTPIIVPIVKSDGASLNLVFVPGVGAQENGSKGWAGKFNFAVGVSGDVKAGDRVTFFGGISIGVGGTTGREASLGAGITLGMDVKVHKADDINNWDNYVGIKASGGFDILKGNLGFNVGLTTKFQLDIGKRYSSQLKDRLASEGITDYIEKLATAEEDASNKNALADFANEVKTGLGQKLHITQESSTEEAVAAFKGYVEDVRSDFDQKFDLPPVTGGEFDVSVVHGALIISGIATGNVPLIIGTTAAWGIQVLSSLDFNVGSETRVKRSRNTSEGEMQGYHGLERARQLEALQTQFNNMPVVQSLEKGGVHDLDAQGKIRTEAVSTSTLETIKGKTLLDYNDELREKGIRLEKDKDGRIKIILLPFITDGQTNVRVAIAPNIATFDENGNLYLKNPNAIRQLYVHKQSNNYSFKTNETENKNKAIGANRETVILINNDENADKKPEVVLTKYNGETGWNIEQGFEGKADAYQGGIDMKAMRTAYEAMMKNQGAGGPKETLREKMDFKQQARALYAWKSKKTGETFLSITNQGGKKAIDENGDNYSKEKLFQFFEEYSEAKGIKPPFNGVEKNVLMLECSTLRYIKLEKGQTKEALDWARRKVLIKAFKNRIQNIESKTTYKFKKSAEELAKDAVKDLEKISTDDPIDDTINERTMASIAIGGHGQDGFHHLLNARMNGYPGDYGFIVGHNYNEALRDENHPQHELALVLKEQMAPLPKVNEDLSNTKEVNEFMDTPLARSVWAIGALGLVLGPKNNDQVQNYVNAKDKNPAVIAQNKEGLTEFMDIVKQLRNAQDHDLYALNIKGYDGQEHMFLLRLGIDSGVFNKCGNYSILFSQDVAIVPKAEALKVFVTGSNALTTTNVKEIKDFYGLTGGLSATVDITTDRKIITPTPVKPDAGPGKSAHVNDAQHPYQPGPDGSGTGG